MGLLTSFSEGHSKLVLLILETAMDFQIYKREAILINKNSADALKLNFYALPFKKIH